MIPSVPLFAASTRTVIARQALIGAAVALVYLVSKGRWEAQSALYGGLISIVSATLLSAGVNRAGQAAQQSDIRRGTAILFVAAVQRFIVVLVLFGAGLYLLELAPLATIAGFAAAQLAFLMVGRQLRAPPGMVSKDKVSNARPNNGESS